MDAQQQYGGARGPGGAGAAGAAAAETPFPWVPVAVGAGVLVGGGLLFNYYRKKKLPIGAAASKITPTKTQTTLPALNVPTVTQMTTQTTAPAILTDPEWGLTSPGSGTEHRDEPSTAPLTIKPPPLPKAPAGMVYEKGILVSQKDVAAEADSDGQTSRGLTIGSVRVDTVRTVDDVRRHLHKALCDHPDYRGIGFCKVGGEVGIAVASKNRPLHLPGRIGGVPILTGCC